MSSSDSPRKHVDNATSDYKVRKSTWISGCSGWVFGMALVASSLMGCAAETDSSV